MFHSVLKYRYATEKYSSRKAIRFDQKVVIISNLSCVANKYKFAYWKNDRYLLVYFLWSGI